MPPKTVAQKLFIRENYEVLLLDGPSGYRKTLGKLPVGVTVSTRATGKFDLIQFFVTSAKELQQRLPKLKSKLQPGGLLWVTYPKGSSKIDSDINRDSIYNFAATVGLQGVAMIAVDDDWSAFRFKKID